jgi:aryl-alcohol dehydrogenase-like predicted oxidoreductase
VKEILVRTRILGQGLEVSAVGLGTMGFSHGYGPGVDEAEDGENIRANQPLLDLITEFAHTKGASAAQVSLAWMLHKYDFLVPIPGSRKLERIQENLGAADVDLTDDEFTQIEAQLATVTIHGNRTDEDIAKLRQID